MFGQGHQALFQQEAWGTHAHFPGLRIAVDGPHGQGGFARCLGSQQQLCRVGSRRSRAGLGQIAQHLHIQHGRVAHRNATHGRSGFEELLLPCGELQLGVDLDLIGRSVDAWKIGCGLCHAGQRDTAERDAANEAEESGWREASCFHCVSLGCATGTGGCLKQAAAFTRGFFLFWTKGLFRWGVAVSRYQ